MNDCFMLILSSLVTHRLLSLSVSPQIRFPALPRYTPGTLISSLYSLVFCAVTLKPTYTTTSIPRDRSLHFPSCILSNVHHLLSLFFPLTVNVSRFFFRRFFCESSQFLSKYFLLFDFPVRVITFSAVRQASHIPYSKSQLLSLR